MIIKKKFYIQKLVNLIVLLIKNKKYKYFFIILFIFLIYLSILKSVNN